VRARPRRTRLRLDAHRGSLLLLCNKQCCYWLSMHCSTLCARLSAFTCARLVSYAYVPFLHASYTSYSFTHTTHIHLPVCTLLSSSPLVFEHTFSFACSLHRLAFYCRTIHTFGIFFSYPYMFCCCYASTSFEIVVM
jgi:hypothetical protein